MRRATDASSTPSDACIAALNATEGVEARFTQAHRDVGLDGILSITGPWGKARYAVENVGVRATAEVVERKLPALEAAARAAKLPPLLMASYINPALAERLRARGVDFVDAAGNALLRRKGLFVWVSGKRAEVRAPRPSRAFQAAGLRLVTVLLQEPAAVTWTVRALAEASGVALGTVGPVLEDLRAAGHVRAPRGQRVLVRRRALFDRWELGYLEALRPRLLRRTCRAAGGADLDALARKLEAPALRDHARIGGELAAARLTGHLRPQRASLFFSRGTAEELMVALRLLPDPDGNIDLLQTPVPHQEGDGPLTGPLLIHAELTRSFTEGRVREAADLVFERHLRQRMEEP